MTKYTCTLMGIGEIFYATLVAENDQQARELAVKETNEQFFGNGGRPRNWTVAVLEQNVEGPPRVLDCGQREA